MIYILIHNEKTININTPNSKNKGIPNKKKKKYF